MSLLSGELPWAIIDRTVEKASRSLPGLLIPLKELLEGLRELSELLRRFPESLSGSPGTVIKEVPRGASRGLPDTSKRLLEELLWVSRIPEEKPSRSLRRPLGYPKEALRRASTAQTLQRTSQTSREAYPGLYSFLYTIH